MRWQRQHWSTEDFDFTEDAQQWADPDMFTDEERRFMSSASRSSSSARSG